MKTCKKEFVVEIQAQSKKKKGNDDLEADGRMVGWYCNSTGRSLGDGSGRSKGSGAWYEW